MPKQQEYVSKNDYIQYRVNINQLTKKEKFSLIYYLSFVINLLEQRRKIFEENLSIDVQKLISNIEEFHCLLMIFVDFYYPINSQVQIPPEDILITN